MTPQELKNSILQLAIQGKLVEQHKEEGTGEELYQQIQAEKQRLIKAGNIKKEKPLPEITEDEKPFDIPESWIWVRITELGEVIGGGTPKTEHIDYWDDAGVPWLTPADMKFIIGKYAERGKRNISALGLEKSSAQLMPKGTVLYSSRAPIGYIAIAANDMATNQGFKSLVPTVTEINEFIYYCLIVRTNDIVSRASGTTFKEISGKDFGLTIVPLPPLAEQKRIVAKIEELMPYIDRYEKAWSKLEDFSKRFPNDMQKSILQTAIQGKLVEQRPEEGTGEELYEQIQTEKHRFIRAGTIKKENPLQEITEDEKPFDIPESWKWVRVGSITTLNPKNVLDDTLDVAFIPMPCVSDGFRNQHTFEVRKWKEIKKGFTHFANGDIGVAKITPCFQNRKSVIFSKLENGYGAGTTELSIVRVLENTLVRDYLLWFFKTEHFIVNGVKSFSGTAGQQRIYKDYLANCLIPLPPLAEQQRIVAKIEELLPLCEKLKR